MSLLPIPPVDEDIAIPPRVLALLDVSVPGPVRYHGKICGQVVREHGQPSQYVATIALRSGMVRVRSSVPARLRIELARAIAAQRRRSDATPSHPATLTGSVSPPPTELPVLVASPHGRRRHTRAALRLEAGSPTRCCVSVDGMEAVFELDPRFAFQLRHSLHPIELLPSMQPEVRVLVPPIALIRALDGLAPGFLPPELSR